MAETIPTSSMEEPDTVPGSTDPRLDETMSLIGSNKVEGAKVERPGGDHIGTIRWLMIDKASGKVVYVVMSFGGFFTLGENFYPVPWDTLRYDPARDAYILDVDEETLRAAPRFADEMAYNWTPGEGQRVRDYYGAPTI